MLANIARKRIYIYVVKCLPQLATTAANNHMFVDFDVGHGQILFSQTALKFPKTSAKQGQLPKTGVAMAQLASKEGEIEAEPVSVEGARFDGALDFVSQIGSDNLVGIQQ